MIPNIVAVITCRALLRLLSPQSSLKPPFRFRVLDPLLSDSGKSLV